MSDVQLAEEFPVKVLHGDFLKDSEGGTHFFRVSPRLDGSLRARFEMNNGAQTIAIADIDRLELSSGKMAVNLKRWPYTVGAIGVSLITPLPWILEAAAIAGVAATTLLEEQARFVCTTKDGKYFAGEVLQLGYCLAHTIWQSPNWQPVVQTAPAPAPA